MYFGWPLAAVAETVGVFFDARVGKAGMGKAGRLKGVRRRYLGVDGRVHRGMLQICGVVCTIVVGYDAVRLH
jgi:hypothetical protein